MQHQYQQHQFSTCINNTVSKFATVTTGVVDTVGKFATVWCQQYWQQICRRCQQHR